MKLNLLAFLCFLISCNIYAGPSFNQNQDPLAPNWSSAQKTHVSSSYDLDSKIWLSTAHGILTETYFPTIDEPQIKDAQLIITNDEGLFFEERKNALHETVVHTPYDVEHINSHPEDLFVIKHNFFLVPEKNQLVDRVTVEAKVDGLRFHWLINTSLKNSGYHDSGLVTDINDKKVMVFFETDRYVTAYSNIELLMATVSAEGVNDGYQDLLSDGRMNYENSYIERSNIAGLAQLDLPSTSGTYQFDLVYHFDVRSPFIVLPEFLSTSQISHSHFQYKADWQNYLSGLNVPANISSAERDLYFRSLYTMKVHEDKTYRGALIASLSKPWGESTFDSPNQPQGGYHFVWPRDLYNISLGFLLAGDKATVIRSLRYLKSIQYRQGVWNYGQRRINRVGAFPQNTWVRGEDYWSGLQIDQTAYPILLFVQMYQEADSSLRKVLIDEFSSMIIKALRFMTTYGPWSAQERWEENWGISPSSFAGTVAAINGGSRLMLQAIHDFNLSINPFEFTEYLSITNEWLTKPNDNIHTWTYTNQGVMGDGEYYVRVAGCESFDANWNPNSNGICHVANSGNRVNLTEMIDQGFLQLTLLGLVPANDLRIINSLKEVNRYTRLQTPHGPAWYRYVHDAYGEEGRGRLWPLLSSEHGRYLIELNKLTPYPQFNSELEEIVSSYLGFANKGNLLPEQVFETTGEGTEAATPLAWSHAEFIKLLWSRELNHNIENLDILRP